MASLTVIPSDPLAKFLFPVSMTLCSSGLEDLVSWRNAIIRKHNDSLSWKLRQPLGHLWFLMLLNQQVKETV